MRERVTSGTLGPLSIAWLSLTMVAGCWGAARDLGDALPSEGHSDHASATKVHCLMAYSYTVDNDELTVQCSSSQEIYPDDDSIAFRVPCAVRAVAALPRFQSAFEIDSFQGHAELLDGSELVDTVAIDKAFIFEGGTAVVAYTAPDGASVELHVWSRLECATPPEEPLGREEIAALEDAP